MAKITPASTSADKATLPASLLQGLDAFSLETFEMEFGRLTNDQKSEALGKFFLREILAQSMDDLGVDQINENWLDVSKDKGIDFLYRANGQVVILQSKYRKPDGSIQRSDLDQTRNILSTLRHLKSDDLPELLAHTSEIDWKNDGFQILFLCSCRVSPAMKESFQSRRRHGDRAEKNAQFELIDLPELERRYDLALGTVSSLPSAVRLAVMGDGTRQNFTFSKEPRPTYLFVTSGASLVDAYRSYNQALFHYNLRFSLGSTKVNKGIMKTAREKPECFLSYNNGISCIAESATLVENDTAIEGARLQVINGAQTVSSLVDASIPQTRLWEIQVPVKLTVVNNMANPTAEERGYIEGIIRCNNTQNPTKFADTRSRDAFHKSLEKFFGRERFRGKQVEYRPKRIRKTASKEKTIYKIYLEDFCKTLYAFLDNPVHFTSDSSFLFSIEPKSSGYLKLFGKEDGKLPPRLSNAICAKYAAIWWICDYVRHELVEDRKKLRKSDNRQDKADHQALERAYFVFSAMRNLLEKSGSIEKLPQYSSPKWREAEAGARLKKIKAYYEKAKWTVIQSHREAMKDQRSHRSWLSSTDTLRSIESYADPILEFLPKL
jgi:hypothetical protein